MTTIVKRITFFHGVVSLIGWMNLPSHCQETSDRTSVTPFIAYGASATSHEVVSVRFSQSGKQLKPTIVQREPTGCECAPVIYHEKLRLLYVLSLRAKNDEQNKMVIFSVDEGGRLKLKKKLPMKHGSAYASFDRTGRYILSVSYFEGHVDVYRLDDNGMPTHVSNTFENRNKAHSILTAPNNRSVYVPYVKDNNALFQYSFDQTAGALRSLVPAQSEVPDGVGPRHVAFHPTRPFVFFSNEQQLGASTYRMADDGQLSLIQVCDPGELKAAQGLAASDIVITPDGRHLFVAVRDFANDKQHGIHRYGVQNDGRLVHLGATEADAIPWGMKLSPDSRHLLVTATHGETLTALLIGKDGGLTKRSSIKWGNMIRAIAIVPVK